MAKIGLKKIKGALKTLKRVETMYKVLYID